MDLAMVKQEQSEMLCQYMWHFFYKREIVVDVTDKEIIDLFQDRLYHRRTFEDFGHRHPSSITKLNDMITSWADKEDKANAKYDSICGKSKHNTGGKNNKDQGLTTTTTTTRVLTASVSQTTQSRLYNTLRRTTRKRPLVASKTCSKRSVCGIWRAITPPSSATNYGEHSKIYQTLGLLTTKRARRKPTKASVNSRNLTKW
jgi:hypothetical protein